MNFEEFIKFTGNIPIIETEILLAGVSNSLPVKVQISRWEKAGKLIQLKRGVYLLSPQYRKIEPYALHIAAVLKKPSYVSLEKALEFYNIIPEAVLVFTSVTTKRQATFKSQMGTFAYRHIKEDLFWGYKSVALDKQIAFVATPEKALLDLCYFNDFDITKEYVEELRLQNVDEIDIDKLLTYSRKFNKPKLLKAAKVIVESIRSQLQGQRRS